MPHPSITISETQSLALTLLDDPTVVSLLFGGGAGGAKSMLVCVWMLLQCRNYAGIRIGLGRDELVRLKQSTVVTMLSKVHPMLKVQGQEFVYNDQRATITYANDSQIQLVNLAWEPSDPDYDRFGSTEYTHTVIEEVGECRKKAVDVFTSRKNRFLNLEHGLVGKTVMTTNPTQNFARAEYYEPYRALGMGPYQKWPDGLVHLPDGRVETAYRAFVRSLVADNPFADPNYIEELRRKPPAERKRLLEGNWDYQDEDYRVFNDLTIDRATISELTPGRKVLGVDVADGGKDKTVIACIDNGVLVDLVHVQVDATGEKDVAEQNALAVIKYATQNGVKPRDIAIDAVGVGAGVRVALRARGWFPELFNSGSTPTEPGYDKLRSEQYWQTSQDMQHGSLKVYRELAHLTELRQELKAHEYAAVDKYIKVLPKDKVKELLGHSPDFADAVVMARWIWSGNGSKKAEQHIIF